MEIERTPLWKEVLAVAQAGPSNSHYMLDVIVHLPDGTEYKVFKVVDYDIVCDYVVNYTDGIFLTVRMMLGDYAYMVYPVRDNLEITVTMVPTTETGAGDSQSAAIVKRYKATLVDKGNPIIDVTSGDFPSQDTLNRRDIPVVQFQLIDKAVDKLSKVSVGGVWSNSKIEDIIKTIMTNESQRILIDGDSALKGVDMVPASNQQVNEQVVLPQGVVRLVDVPNYIQNCTVGVYTAGMGYYLTNGFWYIYPSYDVTRFNQTNRVITVINVPENRMPGFERTFLQTGDHVSILAGGKVSFRDPRRANQQNFGNGVRFGDANKFMSGFATSKDGKTMVQQADNVSEFVTDQTADGTNFAPMSAHRITSNPYRELSTLAARRGAFFSLIWEHSDPKLILPGMLAEIHYISGDEVAKAIGVIVKAHHHTTFEGEGFAQSRYVRRSVLTFFVESDVS